MLKLLLAAALAAPTIGAASELLGPIQHLQGKHIGDADPITWTIEYYDGWGRTFVDQNGGHFYHDRCCRGYLTHDSSWNYPAEYWGRPYVMYYIGTTMKYRIRLTNNGPRNYSNLRVVAIQEYMTADGSWGERIGPDAAKDWFLESLDAGETVVLEGSLYIPWGAHGGLDQTHLQVQHWNRGQGQPGAGSVILDDTHAAIWCPPEAGAPGADGASDGIIGSAASTTAVATIRVTPATSGTITTRVYDRSGTLVRTITTESGGSAVTVSWDGRDQNGTAVAPGAYLVLVDGPGIRLREKVAVVR